MNKCNITGNVKVFFFGFQKKKVDLLYKYTSAIKSERKNSIFM